MTMPRIPRLSASRLKSLHECTMKFYMNEMLMLPEKTWPRTICGSLSHAVLECLYRARHRHHLDVILAAQTIYASSAVARLVQRWQIKHAIAPDLIADIDPMVMLAITKTNFLDVGATQTFEPEHEFLLTLPGGGIIKGFIDKLAIFGDRAIITDFKSQRNRFTKDELINNVQASVYQLYAWKTFGIPAEVQFVMLRHPPTSRTPDKHIQTVPPMTPAQMVGFEYYLEHMYGVLKGFGVKDAYAHMHDDKGFCERVCSYRRPFSYWSITKLDGTPVRRVWIDPKTNDLDTRPEIGYDERVELLSNPGCARFNT